MEYLAPYIKFNQNSKMKKTCQPQQSMKHLDLFGIYSESEKYEKQKYL